MTNYRDLEQKCGVKELDDLDIVKVLTDGQNVQANQRTLSPGIVRGGSAGALIDGQVFGNCHRKSWLRYNGIETPLETTIELMTNQGEKNEDIWLEELRDGLPEHLEVRDQDSVECVWSFPWKVGRKYAKGSGSVDLSIWEKETNTPVRGLELKNLSSVSTVKSVHYELQPKTDHLIQAANYSLRMGDQYLGGKPLPYQLVYSNRSIWHIFAMSEKVKAAVLDKGWDVEWRWGKPMSVKPFHRVYNLDWDVDGTLRYWTPGLESWVSTKITRESIDNYYEVVSSKIDAQNNLGPRPSANHVDGSKSYSPCNYCDFSEICKLNEEMSPQEFKDHATKFANEQWEKRK